MAYYKVPQNVESEDKLLGPLSFKQFIYAIVAAVLIAGVIFGFKASPVIGVLFIPPTFIFLVLAFYQRPDQPVESYLVALLGYWFKPRARTWDRDGISEHVLITAPKRIPDHFSDGRSREQVTSQLGQLAQVVDTRGWSTRGVDTNLSQFADDDRLVGIDEISHNNPQNPMQAALDNSEDIQDIDSSQIAQNFEAMAGQAAAARNQAIGNPGALQGGQQISRASERRAQLPSSRQSF